MSFKIQASALPNPHIVPSRVSNNTSSTLFIHPLLSDTQAQPISTRTPAESPQVKPSASFEGSEISFPSASAKSSTEFQIASQSGPFGSLGPQVSQTYRPLHAGENQIPEDMPKRVRTVVEKLPKYLKPEVAAQIGKLLTPEALTAMAAVASAYGAAHATGVPWVIDSITAGIVGLGAYAVGLDIGQAAVDLKEAYTLTFNAKTDADLDKASKNLAKAISVLGVDTVLSFAVVKGSQLLKSGSAYLKPSVDVVKAGASKIKGALAPLIPKGWSISRAKSLTIVNWVHPNGGMVKVARKGNVYVDLNKIELYARGKTKPYTQAMESERRGLNQFKQSRRKEFDRDPANQKRLDELTKLKHNIERSTAMRDLLRKAGLENTPENNRALIQHLLEAGEQVTKVNNTSTSIFHAPKGDISIQANWKVFDDGRKYLSTIILKPQF